MILEDEYNAIVSFFCLILLLPTKLRSCGGSRPNRCSVSFYAGNIVRKFGIDSGAVPARSPICEIFEETG